jgi:hypothetical protein
MWARVLLGCGCLSAPILSAAAPGSLEPGEAPGAQAYLPEDWKVLLVAGSYTDEDQEILNWDRAMEGMQDWLLVQGVLPQNIRILTSTPTRIGRDQRGTEVQPAEVRFIEESLVSLDINEGEPVMIYISSHGGKNLGIWFERRREYLSSNNLHRYLETYLPQNPAVILLSACYSGQFIQGEVSGEDHYTRDADSLVQDHRIILTAARNDRSSFGCGAGSKMPVWDAGLMEALAEAGPESSWRKLAQRVKDYVKSQEQGYEEDSRSYPQASVPQQADQLLAGLFASP